MEYIQSKFIQRQKGTKEYGPSKLSKSTNYSEVNSNIYLSMVYILYNKKKIRHWEIITDTNTFLKLLGK